MAALGWNCYLTLRAMSQSWSAPAAVAVGAAAAVAVGYLNGAELLQEQRRAEGQWRSQAGHGTGERA